jgi:hypothetical protein
MKNKVIYKDENGLQFACFINQNGETVWEENNGVIFTSTITDRQYQYLIQLTSFKNTVVSRSMMKDLEDLNNELTFFQIDPKFEGVFHNPLSVQRFIEALNKLTDYDLNELSGISKLDLKSLKKRVSSIEMDYKAGRPPENFIKTIREVITDKTSQFIHENNLVVDRMKYNKSGLVEFYTSIFKLVESIYPELIFSDEKRFKQLIENSLKKNV